MHFHRLSTKATVGTTLIFLLLDAYQVSATPSSAEPTSSINQRPASVPNEASQSATQDFGDAITYEAVDLSAAQSAEASEDAETLQGLLHWAISHSDTALLRQQAEDATTEQAVDEAVRTLAERKERVQELHKHMSQAPSEAAVMKEAIALLRNTTSSETELLAALEALQLLVELVDNANDLRGMGGIAPVAAQLAEAAGPQLQIRAAHVLGTAASNNPQFQRDLLEEVPTVIPDLLRVVASGDGAAAAKGLYAVGAIVRNTDHAVQAFLAADGITSLGHMMSGEAVPPRLKLRSLTLLVDLATGDRRDAQLLHRVLHQGRVAGIITQLLLGTQRDAAEAALSAVQALLRDSPDAHRLLREAGAGIAAAQLHEQLVTEGTVHEEESEDGGGQQYHTYLVALAREVVAALGGCTDGKACSGGDAGGMHAAFAHNVEKRKGEGVAKHEL